MPTTEGVQHAANHARPASKDLLLSRPTPEAVAAFARLSAEERLSWLDETRLFLLACTPPEVQARWAAGRDPDATVDGP